MGIQFYLKELLKEKSVTQKELSDKTGIRLPTISDICNNNIKQFPVKAMDSICNYLRCQPYDFIRYISEEDLKKIEHLRKQKEEIEQEILKIAH